MSQGDLFSLFNRARPAEPPAPVEAAAPEATETESPLASPASVKAAKAKSTKAKVSKEKKPRGKKGGSASEEPREITWTLAELPSSQHRAGLVGLLQMIKWVGRRQWEEPGHCEVVEEGAYRATVRLDREGVRRLFDEVYGACLVEREVKQKRKKKDKTVIEPLREVQREAKDDKGKVKTQTWYVYEDVEPQGAFLVDFAPAGDAEQRWVKLWRDMLWSVLRGIAAQREPFNARAEEEGRHVKDADSAWMQLCLPEQSLNMRGIVLLGAQDTTAENVPFQDRSRFRFLLHFWPFIAQTYIPQVVDEKTGKLNSDGFVVAIPDVADLKRFGRLFEQKMRERDVAVAGFRPRQAMVTLPAEGGLKFLIELCAGLALEGGATARSVLGVDLYHLNKAGNVIDFRAIERVEPERRLLEAYDRLQRVYWSPIFRRQRIQNLASGARWFDGFDRLMRTRKQERFLKDSWFGHDARRAMDDNERLEEHTSQDAEGVGLETLVYRAVRTYVSARIKAKEGLEYSALKEGGTERQRQDYNEAKEKIARGAFLAARSRTAEDFVSWFSATLCSVPQYLGEERYLKLARALREQPEDVRTLTMLALSANSTPVSWKKES